MTDLPDWLLARVIAAPTIHATVHELKDAVSIYRMHNQASLRLAHTLHERNLALSAQLAAVRAEVVMLRSLGPQPCPPHPPTPTLTPLSRG